MCAIFIEYLGSCLALGSHVAWLETFRRNIEIIRSISFLSTLLQSWKNLQRHCWLWPDYKICFSFKATEMFCFRFPSHFTSPCSKDLCWNYKGAQRWTYKFPFVYILRKVHHWKIDSSEAYIMLECWRIIKIILSSRVLLKIIGWVCIWLLFYCQQEILKSQTFN